MKKKNMKEVVVLKSIGQLNEKERDAYEKKCTHELLVMTKPAWKGESLKLMIPTTKENLKKLKDGDNEMVRDLAHVIEESEGLGNFILGLQDIDTGKHAKEIGSIELRGDSFILKLKD
jgi:hypothetical protein